MGILTENFQFVIGFLTLMFIVVVFISLALRWVYISSTKGAMKRLEEDIAKANAKQAELSNKLKEAEEELMKRKAEARQLAEKMRAEAEEASKAERERILAEARKEAEEIITKAQNSKDKIRQELQKEFDLKVYETAMKVLNEILSEKAKGAFDEVLVEEFLSALKDTDMSRISPDINEVEVITQNPLPSTVKAKISEILKEKLKRSIVIKDSVDTSLGGGIILKFASMALDGSMRNFIREKAYALMSQTEQGT